MRADKDKAMIFLRLIGKGLQKGGAALLLLFPAALVTGPLLLLLSGSLMDRLEMGKYIGTVFTEGTEFIRWKLMPDYPLQIIKSCCLKRLSFLSCSGIP